MTILTHTLPNGFRVVTEDMPGLASATVGIWVLAGGRHEGPGETGVAHFLEHMAFKGTARRSAVQIAEEIEDVGGYLNAYTSKEMTAFYARVLSADVALAVDLVGDIVLNPAFAPEEIAIERGVILQEIGQAHDTPDDIIFDWLQEVSYPGQSFGRSILGPAEIVRRLDRADLARFTSRFYTPERMILAAAGGIDHDAILKLAETLFGGLRPGHAAVPEPASFRGGERRVQKDLEQAHFAMALEAPGVRDDAVYAGQVFATALGGGMSSRLFQEIREKRGLCYSIHAQASAYEDTGCLTVYAGTGGEDLAELVTVTAEEMRRAVAGLSEGEVARARAQLKAGMLMGLESPSSRCERLARMLAVWGRVPDVAEVVAKIDAVDAARARALGAALLARPPAVTLYGPVAAAPDLGTLTARLAA